MHQMQPHCINLETSFQPSGMLHLQSNRNNANDFEALLLLLGHNITSGMSLKFSSTSIFNGWISMLNSRPAAHVIRTDMIIHCDKQLVQQLHLMPSTLTSNEETVTETCTNTSIHKPQIISVISGRMF
jgi:hypothetical protein